MNDALKNKVRNSIHFNSERKHNDVNCYAFAVGIDLPEKDICDYAFDPGQIGTYINYFDNFRNYQNMCAYMHSKSVQDRFGYDMDTLGIEVSEADEEDMSEYFDEEGYYNWLFAMYSLKPRLFVPSDVHCLRKTKDGIWVHKLGRDGLPSMVDPNGNLLTALPEELAYSKKRVYTNPSVYRLRMKR